MLVLIVFGEGHFTPKKSRTPLTNPFVFKKNPSKILINPFVLKKSRTLFPMSEVPLGVWDGEFVDFINVTR